MSEYFSVRIKKSKRWWDEDDVLLMLIRKHDQMKPIALGDRWRVASQEVVDDLATRLPGRFDVRPLSSTNAHFVTPRAIAVARARFSDE